MKLEDILTTVHGRKIDVNDVVGYLKISGNFRNAIYDLIKWHVVDLKCEEMKINFSETEITKKHEDKRMMSGFGDPEVFHNYLKANGITIDQWKHFASLDIKKDALKNKLITKDEIEKYFNKNKDAFTTVGLARIICDKEENIKKAKKQITKESDFSSIARTFSIDKNTRYTGGYMGEVRKGMLSPDVEKQAFSSKENSLIGPFKENSYWTLYKVFEVKPAELNNTVAYWIRDRIFNEWIHKEVHSASA